MERSKILVVDDEEAIRSLLKRTLGKQGYDVELAADGNTAVGKIKRNFFNLLITDLKMAKVDGIRVLKEIKNVNPYIEVIMVTGYPTIESAVEAIKIGAFDYICKPFDLPEMISTVDRCLDKQKFAISHIELSELMVLFEISRTITTTTNLNSLLKSILNSALELVKAKRGSFLLFDERTKELRIKAARGLSDEVMNNTRLKLGEGICGEVIQEGKSVLVTDIEQDPRYQSKNKPRYKTKSFLSVPLIGKYPQASILGVINVADKISGENFTEREKTLLSVLTRQAVTVIENYRLYSQLQNKIEDLKHSLKELNETQNQLIQSEKMVAMGRLAFGIAHEIRNPLGIILGGVELLEGNIAKEDNAAKESIEKIKYSINRANNIILDLLKFSRASKLELNTVNICELIDEIISLVINQANLKNIRISKKCLDENIQIMADSTMLQQVFFNLYVNAIDAMPEGGELLLNIYSARTAGRNESDVIIEVCDTGKGISQNILSKIFDPFFTTKEPGKGTGLGLSIVHLILERHKGTINVESKINQGTKFIVRLPAERKGGGNGRREENTFN